MRRGAVSGRRCELFGAAVVVSVAVDIPFGSFGDMIAHPLGSGDLGLLPDVFPPQAVLQSHEVLWVVPDLEEDVVGGYLRLAAPGR